MKKLTLFLTLSLLTLIGTSTVVKAEAGDAPDSNPAAEIATEEKYGDSDTEEDDEKGETQEETE